MKECTIAPIFRTDFPKNNMLYIEFCNENHWKSYLEVWFQECLSGKQKQSKKKNNKTTLILIYKADLQNL